MFLQGDKLREVFFKAKKNRFGLIASNVVFDSAIRPIIQGYEMQKADGLLQMSAGACKYAAGVTQDIKVGAQLISSTIKIIASQFKNSGVGLHIDHATPNYFDFIVFCIENNLVSSVMIDASQLDLAENIKITKEVVDFAHKYNVLVEGEIGHIKGSEDEIVSDTELYTKPEEALEFVMKTNVDLFAASVGTNHGVTIGAKVHLHLDLIKEIDNLLIAHNVERGLVLHGASGLTDEQQQTAVKNGVIKINKDTSYQMVMAEAVQKFWEKEKYSIVCPPDVNISDYVPDKGKFDPRKWLGKAEQASQQEAETLIKIVNSNNNSIFL